jgi:hypothetical protein
MAVIVMWVCGTSVVVLQCGPAPCFITLCSPNSLTILTIPVSTQQKGSRRNDYLVDFNFNYNFDTVLLCAYIPFPQCACTVCVQTIRRAIIVPFFA